MLGSRSKWLANDEQIVQTLTATIEIDGTLGVYYEACQLLATNQRIILYTEYPIIKWSEIMTYDYHDIMQLDVLCQWILFVNGQSLKIKLINQGHARRFLEFAQFHAKKAPGIRNFHQ